MNAVEWVDVGGFDLSCQTRLMIDAGAVADYSAVLAEGGELPPGEAFRDGDGTLFLSSGFHRRAAYQRAGLRTMPVVVRPGGRWEALCFGVQDNAGHVGVRLSRADRREAVKRLLLARPESSNAAVAEAARVSDKTVAAVRSGLEATSEIPESAIRAGRDGRMVNTANVGARPKMTSEIPESTAVDDVDKQGGSAAGESVLAENMPSTERPRRFLDAPLESRRTACNNWWDILQTHVLLLDTAGWSVPTIAETLGVTEREVVAILDPQPPEQDFGHGHFGDPVSLSQRYRNAVRERIAFMMMWGYDRAKDAAEREGFGGIEGELDSLRRQWERQYERLKGSEADIIEGFRLDGERYGEGDLMAASAAFCVMDDVRFAFLIDPHASYCRNVFLMVLVEKRGIIKKVLEKRGGNNDGEESQGATGGGVGVAG